MNELPPEAVWEQLWSLLEESGVLKKKSNSLTRADRKKTISHCRVLAVPTLVLPLR